jgi:hypothetical protein
MGTWLQIHSESLDPQWIWKWKLYNEDGGHYDDSKDDGPNNNLSSS